MDRVRDVFRRALVTVCVSFEVRAIIRAGRWRHRAVWLFERKTRNGHSRYVATTSPTISTLRAPSEDISPEGMAATSDSGS